METKQIVRRLLSGSILRTFSLASIVIVSFFMLPFLVHNLGDEQYGLWVVVGSIVGFYGIFDLGLATAVGKYTANSIGKQDYENVNTIINTALILFGILGLGVIFLSLVGAGLSLYLKDGDNATLFALLFIVMGTNIGLQFPLRTFSGVLSSQMRFDLLVYTELFRLFLRTSLIVSFVLQGYGVLALAVITFVVEILGNCLELFLVTKNAPFLKVHTKYFQRSLIKQLAHYSWAAFITNISEMARCKLVPVFVTAFLGLGYVVVYSIALRLLEYLEMLMKSCIGFIMPVLSRFEGEDNHSLMQTTFEYTTIFGIVVTLFVGSGILFYGEIFITLWVGQQYIESYNITLLMLIPMILITIQLPSKEMLFAISKHKIYAFLSSSSVGVFAVLSFLMSYTYGLHSIAYAFLVGLTLFEVIKPYYVAKAINRNVVSVYTLYVSTIGKAAIVLGVIYYFIEKVSITTYTDVIICAMLHLFVYSVVGYFILLPQRMRNTLQQMIIIPIIRRVFA